ncbi:DinB family protein [Pseudonocardia endophytica]|uniref:Uncharacterized protein DUF664 n=1 Tax=Pseudonocardia endophytica TaxID=401976 RepID=A0A4R1HZI1_PSEEN|nr:DinB family protein [Pseudonocardia endophytica]TCK26981.1 uncharacterized protein DUF664 [Pseudonocardia endophytica]
MSDRAVPPMNADEHTTLAGWLDFYRATLIGKCDGLDETQVRTASVPPSSLTLIGLVQHAAEVERNWFRRVLTGQDVPSISGEPTSPEGHDGGFELRDDVTFADALVAWEKEVAVARANCAGRDLDRTSPFPGGDVTLRWIYAHMIGEYARHIGHADLVRERIDGVTGV